MESVAASAPALLCYHRRVIRGLISLFVLVLLIWLGATVKLGKKTTFGHIKSIWQSEPTQELVDGVKDKVKTEYREATSPDAKPAAEAARPDVAKPEPLAPEGAGPETAAVPAGKADTARRSRKARPHGDARSDAPAVER